MKLFAKILAATMLFVLTSCATMPGTTTFHNGADILFDRFQYHNSNGEKYLLFQSSFSKHTSLMVKASKITSAGRYSFDREDGDAFLWIAENQIRFISGNINIETDTFESGYGTLSLFNIDGTPGQSSYRFIIDTKILSFQNKADFDSSEIVHRDILGEEDRWLEISSSTHPDLRIGIRSSMIPSHNQLKADSPSLKLQFSADTKNMYLEGRDSFLTWIDFGGIYDPRNGKLIVRGILNLTSGIYGKEISLAMNMPSSVMDAFDIIDPEILKNPIVTISLDSSETENREIGLINTDWTVFTSSDEIPVSLYVQTGKFPADGKYLINSAYEEAYLVVDDKTQGWVHGWVYADREGSDVRSMSGELQFIADVPPTDKFYRFHFGSGSSDLLDEHSGQISYISEEGNPKLFKLLKNPARGYNYDAYIWIPENWDLSNQHLLVIPNNTGVFDNRIRIHDENTYGALQAGWEGRVAGKLGVPTLVPIFPCPGNDIPVYTHAMTSAAMNVDGGPMERLDRQLLNMIDDTRELVLRETGNAVEEKILLTGYSASGAFASHFTMFYPELVKAYTSGGLQATVMLPSSVYNNVTLPFPLGVADIDKYTNKSFNREAWKKTAHFIYWGDEDTSDPTLSAGLYRNEEPQKVWNSLGKDLETRWKNTIEHYLEATPNVQLITYKGLGHDIVIDDVVDFLRQNSSEEFTPINPSLEAEVFLAE